MMDLLRQGNSRKSSSVEGIFKFNPDTTVVKHHGSCRQSEGNQRDERWSNRGGKRGLVHRSLTVLFLLTSVSFDASSACTNLSSPPQNHTIKTCSIVIVTTDIKEYWDDWYNKHFTRISAMVCLSSLRVIIVERLRAIPKFLIYIVKLVSFIQIFSIYEF